MKTWPMNHMAKQRKDSQINTSTPTVLWNFSKVCGRILIK